MDKAKPEPDIAWTLGVAPSSRWRRRLTRVCRGAPPRGGRDGRPHGMASNPDQHRAQYQTQEARRGSLTVSVKATGTLQPTTQVRGEQ